MARRWVSEIAFTEAVRFLWKSFGVPVNEGGIGRYSG